MNLLFVCSRNQWRSPTAEAMFRHSQEHKAKSAGTEPSARIKINAKMLEWATVVFAMEHHHKRRLLDNFGEVVSSKKIVVLDIPDDYQFMDEELILLLEQALEPHI